MDKYNQLELFENQFNHCDEVTKEFIENQSDRIIKTVNYNNVHEMLAETEVTIKYLQKLKKDILEQSEDNIISKSANISKAVKGMIVKKTKISHKPAYDEDEEIEKYNNEISLIKSKIKERKKEIDAEFELKRTKCYSRLLKKDCEIIEKEVPSKLKLKIGKYVRPKELGKKSDNIYNKDFEVLLSLELEQQDLFKEVKK